MDNLTKLTKAELLALIASGALAPAKAPRAKAEKPANLFRIVKAGMGQTVRTPLKGTVYASGVSFAIWNDETGVKRRAYDGGSFLVIDSRGITAEQATTVAKAWAGNAKLKRETLTGEQAREGMPAVAVACHVLTKAGK